MNTNDKYWLLQVKVWTLRKVARYWQLLQAIVFLSETWILCVICMPCPSVPDHRDILQKFTTICSHKKWSLPKITVPFDASRKLRTNNWLNPESTAEKMICGSVQTGKFRPVLNHLAPRSSSKTSLDEDAYHFLRSYAVLVIVTLCWSQDGRLWLFSLSKQRPQTGDNLWSRASKTQHIAPLVSRHLTSFQRGKWQSACVLRCVLFVFLCQWFKLNSPQSMGKLALLFHTTIFPSFIPNRDFSAATFALISTLAAMKLLNPTSFYFFVITIHSKISCK